MYRNAYFLFSVLLAMPSVVAGADEKLTHSVGDTLYAARAVDVTASDRVAGAVARLSGGRTVIIRPLPPHAGLQPYLAKNAVTSRQFLIYATYDGAHLITGKVFDASSGEDISGTLLAKHQEQPDISALFAEASHTRWVEEGTVTAPLVYVVADVHCGYCRQLHHEFAVRIAAGDVRVRWILVDLLRHDGLSGEVLAAADNGAEAVAAAMGGDNDTVHRLSGGDTQLAALADNHAFMTSHDITGTPYLIWESASGSIQTLAGKPRDIALVLATLAPIAAVPDPVRDKPQNRAAGETLPVEFKVDPGRGNNL